MKEEKVPGIRTHPMQSTLTPSRPEQTVHVHTHLVLLGAGGDLAFPRPGARAGSDRCR